MSDELSAQKRRVFVVSWRCAYKRHKRIQNWFCGNCAYGIKRGAFLLVGYTALQTTGVSLFISEWLVLSRPLCAG